MKSQDIIAVVLLVLCLVSTRMIFLEGLKRQINRMRVHCKVLAGMIVVTAILWASIGYRINGTLTAAIKKKESEIQALSARKAEPMQHNSEVFVWGSNEQAGPITTTEIFAGESGRATTARAYHEVIVTPAGNHVYLSADAARSLPGRSGRGCGSGGSTGGSRGEYRSYPNMDFEFDRSTNRGTGSVSEFSAGTVKEF